MVRRPAAQGVYNGGVTTSLKFALEAANKGLETSQSAGLMLEASYFGLCAATMPREWKTRGKVTD